MQTCLDYLRHGMPEGGSRYRGHGIDDPLSEQGWVQMRRTAEALNSPWDRVVTSPLRRCADFARVLAGELDIPFSIEPDLREVGFGSWEGKTRAQLLDDAAKEYHAFYADPVHNRPPGAEPLEAFGTRVATVFDRLAMDHRGEHLLVVAHAGVIRATLGHVLQAPPANWYRAAVDNAAVSRFVRAGQERRLVWHNWLPEIS